jgi:CAAX prenyl protease-like protein
MPDEVVESKTEPLTPTGRWAAALQHRPWLVFVVPMVVFMVVGTLEPTPTSLGGSTIGLAIPYEAYPLVYAIKIALTVAAMLAVLPGYWQFRIRITPLSLLVGVIGAVAWIGLEELHLEQRLLTPLGLGRVLSLGHRSGFNPMEHFSGNAAWAFLALRFFGLVAVVPIVEVFFLRGFVMRYLVDASWWQVPFGQVNRGALIAGTLFPMAAHPAELVAAAVWFSLVTWLMLRTKSLWDCIAAHAVTNLALGGYVVFTGHWWMM